MFQPLRDVTRRHLFLSLTIVLDSAVEPYCDRLRHPICARKIQNDRSPYR